MDSWNGFRGAAKRLEDIDLPRIGHRIGVGEDVIHAVLDVESRGHGFDARGRPIILFEPHIFYRHMKHDPAKLAEAERQGLAYPKWRRNYPKDSYPRLTAAMALDETTALKSASWGLGQVMGFNHTSAGFDTVETFVRAMMEDEDNHLEAMVQFIITNELDDDLRRLDWVGFSRGYNGAAYARNNYHRRLAQRYAWWQGKPDTPWSPHDAVVEDVEAEILPPADTPNGETEIVAVTRTVVPEQVETQVRQKVNRWGWLTGLAGTAGTGLSALLASDWQTIVTVFGCSAAGLAILLLLRGQIVKAIGDIRSIVEA